MISIAKEAATTILVMTAAIIGAVLMLTVIAALTHHQGGTEHGATTTAITHVVACDRYLSLGAMRSSNAANIPEAASFCVVPNAEA